MSSSLVYLHEIGCGYGSNGSDTSQTPRQRHQQARATPGAVRSVGMLQSHLPFHPAAPSVGHDHIPQSIAALRLEAFR